MTPNRLPYPGATFVALALATALSSAADPGARAGRTLNVLFIGNSFTWQHNLPGVVEAMAEAADPSLSFEVSTVVYGGRRLVDHWRLGTHNFVRIAALTREEQQATLRSLQEMVAKDPQDKYAASALARHRTLLTTLDKPRKPWDVVVLQSYRDDLEGELSLYAQYAPRFAELIRAQGGRVVLYETTPVTQNARPLTAPPDPAPVLAKERVIATLAERIGAAAVPMALVAHRCQCVRPDLTLRFVSDSHLNQTMVYLTACTFYATLFDRSPEGLAIDTVPWPVPPNAGQLKDPDGAPYLCTFAARDRADLQRIAWEAVGEFKRIRTAGR